MINLHFRSYITMLIVMLLLAVVDSTRAEILFADSFELLAPLATRQLDVNPRTILLTTTGESYQLEVGVFDMDENPVSAPVSFRSTRPEVVSVSATGEVTALGPVGSAKVIVATDGALNVAVLVMVADPVEGALVINDEQVESGPELVDPEAELAPGMEIRLVISGINLPIPGTPIVGTGGRAVGGRVLSATPVAGGVEVVLQAVHNGELFDAFAVNETLSAAEAQVELNPDVAALYTIDRRLDGSIELRQRPSIRGDAGSRALSIDSECERTPAGIATVIQGTMGPSFDLIPQFSLDIEESDTGLGRLVLEGSALAVADLQTRTTAGLMGKVTCKYTLGSINFPAPGLLGFLVALETNFGVGFEVAGQIGFTEAIGYDLIVTGEASFSAGIECPDGVCEPVGSASAEADGTFDPVFPSSLDALIGSGQLLLDGSGFFFVDLGVGNPFLASVGFEPLGVNAGLRQRLDVQADTAQATNPAYGSNFRLELFAAAGATTQFESLLNLLGIVVPPLVVEIFEMLAQSPQGTLVITDPNGGSSATPGNPATVQAGTEDEQGELATFEVNLNPATYLGLYAVEEVHILELVDDGAGGQTLESVSSLCTDLNPDPGQTTFTCQTDFLEAGTRQFHLFVRASLFGVPLPFLLEAGNHTQATLEVTQIVFDFPTMVVIPGGTFTQGAPESEPDSTIRERPQRQVTVPTFAMSETEVTFDQWGACVADGGCSHNPDDAGWGRGDRPVIYVSWNDAQEYVTWLSNRTGQDYRLPSESEWEYATRAGSTGRFNTGDCITSDQANFRAIVPALGCPEGIYRQQTLPVGSFAPNAFGLYDTHGNVREWVQDCWNSNYNGAPTDGSAWMTGDCSRAVLRGGSWLYFGQYLRSANRNWEFRGSPDSVEGFRVARSESP